MSYLLDANVFIQAKNLHYGLDFCPAFWEWLVTANAGRLVFSIEKVGDEIEAGADELSQWAEARGPSFFLKPDAATLPALAQVSTWATRQARAPGAGTPGAGASRRAAAIPGGRAHACRAAG
jgi:hypothetical protein